MMILPLKIHFTVLWPAPTPASAFVFKLRMMQGWDSWSGLWSYSFDHVGGCCMGITSVCFHSVWQFSLLPYHLANNCQSLYSFPTVRRGRYPLIVSCLLSGYSFLFLASPSVPINCSCTLWRSAWLTLLGGLCGVCSCTLFHSTSSTSSWLLRYLPVAYRCYHW